MPLGLPLPKEFTATLAQIAKTNKIKKVVIFSRGKVANCIFEKVAPFFIYNYIQFNVTRQARTFYLPV